MTKDVTEARLSIGLPADPHRLPKLFDNRWNIVRHCTACGTLYGDFSADEADLYRVPDGNCGRFWMHKT